jgi:hypothetical protein
MRKLSLIVVSLVALSFAPAALAQCADCIDEHCWWGDPPEYYAADCWYDWCPPCGCYTTGRCFSPQAAKPELALEYQIASVEVRQGDVLLARKVDSPAIPVADKRSTLQHIQR